MSARATLVALLTIAVLAPLGASAAGDLRLAPARLERSIAPGGTVTGELVVKNTTDRTLTISLAVEDVAPGQNSGEAARLLGPERGRWSLKDYIVIPPASAQFGLLPGEERRAEFSIVIPPGTPPGGYYGSVLVVPHSVGEESIAITSRLGSLVFVTVTGAGGYLGLTENFSLEEHGVADRELHFVVDYHNQGPIYVNPYGGITLSGWWGLVRSGQAIDPWFVLPESQRRRELVVPSPVLPGWYTATLQLNRGYDNLVDERTLRFLVWPAWATLVTLIIAALVTWWLVVRPRLQPALLVLLALGAAGAGHLAQGEVASSTNYQIQSDALVSTGAATTTGAVNSTSTSYSLQFTAGEVGAGHGTSTNYSVYAGYQELEPSYVTISQPANATLTGLRFHSTPSTRNVGWTISTPASTGYNLTLAASTDPALQLSGNSDNFDDFTSGDPVFGWTVPDDVSLFGFSPSGTHIAALYKNNGSSCGTGSNTNAACWDGFSTAAQTVAQSPGAATSSTITVSLRAEIGDDYPQDNGTYTAAITATAIAN